MIKLVCASVLQDLVDYNVKPVRIYNNVSKITNLIATLSTYYQQKTGMVFIKQCSRYDFKGKLRRVPIFCNFSVRWLSERTQNNYKKLKNLSRVKVYV